VQLFLIKCRPIEERPLPERIGGQHLHLDQELATTFVTGLDIDDASFGAFEGLCIEGVEQLQADNAFAGGRLQHGIQQADERRLALFAAKDVLECVIDLGIRLRFHGKMWIAVR